MQTAVSTHPFHFGDNLPLSSFLTLWELMPYVKRAELLGGVVYMPTAVSRENANMEARVGTWLGTYWARTPGVESGNDATWLMGQDNAPQPDISLWVSPECGGKVRLRGNLLVGAPDFVAEICLSSTSYDLNQKYTIYEEHGVREYLAVLMHEREVRWHRMSRGRLRVVHPPGSGIYESSTFPGLWLNAAALLADDLAAVLECLNQGIATPEHAAFVKKLALRRKPG